MSRGGQAALSIAWVGITALLGLYVQRNLVVSGDLRLFMPKPATAVERLLLQEVGESPASRLLLVSLQGASPQVLAASSQAFALALRADPLFKAVANGADSVAAVPDKLLPYRYLLSTTLDSARFDTDFLRAQLEERLQDLSSPMAGALEPWIARDPTLEFLKLPNFDKLCVYLAKPSPPHHLFEGVLNSRFQFSTIYQFLLKFIYR